MKTNLKMKATSKLKTTLKKIQTTKILIQLQNEDNLTGIPCHNDTLFKVVQYSKLAGSVTCLIFCFVCLVNIILVLGNLELHNIRQLPGSWGVGGNNLLNNLTCQGTNCSGHRI